MFDAIKEMAKQYVWFFFLVIDDSYNAWKDTLMFYSSNCYGWRLY
jgi:hypothetical protein